MISILMPIYNGIEFVSESVSSVVTQSFKSWELIIGINGYPPNSDTYKIAKGLEAVDERIRVMDFPQFKGKSNTLNAMLEHCRYPYVALLDVDDKWMYSKLEMQVKYLNQYDVIGTRCVWFGEKEGVVPQIPVGDISKFDFTQVNPIINSSSVIRKSLCHWRDNGIEDYDMWLRLRKEGRTFFNCPEILVKHRIHNKSAFNSKGNHLKVADLLKQYGVSGKEDLKTMTFR